MRFSCLQKEFNHALSIASKSVATNNTLPVLNNVLIKAEGRKIFFTSTNLELATKFWIDAEVVNEGEITVPAKLLSSYVNYLSSEKLDFLVENGDTVKITASQSKTSIKGILATEFPSIPVVDREGGFKVSVQDFAEGISQTTFAAALNTTRPILTGVYFYVENGGLKMVSTDSYRLAEKELKLIESIGEVACIVPAKTLMELNSVLGLVKDVSDIEVIVSRNQIQFIVGRVQITSRLIEGQFPNYKQVIPTESKTNAVLKANDLSLVLKRINLFAKENNNKILIKVSADQLSVTTEQTQIGVGEESVPIKLEGEGGEIALNSQFMLDFLSNIKSSEISLSLSDKTRPAIFKPLEKKDYLHIIMPLKI